VASNRCRVRWLFYTLTSCCLHSGICRFYCLRNGQTYGDLIGHLLDKRAGQEWSSRSTVTPALQGICRLSAWDHATHWRSMVYSQTTGYDDMQLTTILLLHGSCENVTPPVFLNCVAYLACLKRVPHIQDAISSTTGRIECSDTCCDMHWS
jgi:hypothetical protein